MIARKFLLALTALLISGTLQAATPKVNHVTSLFAVEQQPADGKKQPLYDLVTLDNTNEKPKSVFSKTPIKSRPRGRIIRAKFLNSNKQIIMFLNRFRQSKSEEHSTYEQKGCNDIYLLDVPSGKIKTIAKNLYWNGWEEPFVVSPDRRKALFPGKDENPLKFWSQSGKLRDIITPKKRRFHMRDIRWPYGSTKPYLPLYSKGSDKEIWCWIDLKSAKLQQMKPNDLAIGADDFTAGKYLKIPQNGDVPQIFMCNRSPVPLTTPDIFSGNYGNSAVISPNGKYAIWFTKQPYEAGPCSDSYMYMFVYDIKSAQPKNTTPQLDDSCPSSIDSFAGWGDDAFYLVSGAREPITDYIDTDATIYRFNLLDRKVVPLIKYHGQANFMDLVEN